MTNLKKIWRICKQKNIPMIGNDTTRFLPFMEEYLYEYSRWDRTFCLQKGMFSPIWNLNEEEDDEAVAMQFRDDVADLLLKNRANYQRLYNLMKANYDPLENYNKTEHIESQDSGKDKTTDDLGGKVRTEVIGVQEETNTQGQQVIQDAFGSQTEQASYGIDKTTNSYGQKTDTDVHGAKSGSLSIGAKTTSSEHSKFAFDSNSYVSDTKDVASDGAQTNSSSEASYTDTHTSNAYTDTATRDAHTDTSTKNSYTDTHTTNEKTDTVERAEHTNTITDEGVMNINETEYGKKNVVDSHIFGNAGVTTSQQMANEEVSLWLGFKFYDILFNEITKELCTFYDEGYDCF